ncbi:MAG: hypothetical protein R2845_05490 [Thermomicrobiales bacterium]
MVQGIIAIWTAVVLSWIGTQWFDLGIGWIWATYMFSLPLRSSLAPSVVAPLVLSADRPDIRPANAIGHHDRVHQRYRPLATIPLGLIRGITSRPSNSIVSVSVASSWTRK